jgi:hypothetical protein
MIKMLGVGLVGTAATLGGLWGHQFLTRPSKTSDDAALAENKHLQVKTEMTGIPIIRNGQVSGYLVFQINSTIDKSKLVTPDFNVTPYILDAAIRASYESTAEGVLEFDADYIEKLSALIAASANKKLRTEAVEAVNVEQFNFVPKDDIRGKAKSSAHQ